MTQKCLAWVLLLSTSALAADAKKPNPRREAKKADAIGLDRRGALVALPDAPALYQSDFALVPYGNSPRGWQELCLIRPSRNWAVDGNGFLRIMLKQHTGTIVLDDVIADATIDAQFKKVEDDAASFGLVARLTEGDNYYHAQFTGDDRLELRRVKGGEATLLAFAVPLKRYREGEVWRMTLALRGPLLTAIIQDASGAEMARVDGNDNELTSGQVGLRCTTYASAKSFRIRTPEPRRAAASKPQASTPTPEYPIVKPVADVESLNTPPAELAGAYDVIVAGAGTGGTSAAIQAARLGSNVLLLETTDWIGGQMSAVPTMDEGMGRNSPVRERGIYREFLESVATYYLTLDKDPFKGDRSLQDSQTECGMEPRIARGVQYGLIAETRARGGKVDISTQTRVIKVQRSGETITGVTVAIGVDPATKTQMQIACEVLIDATEYGDVIPLTGARYRVGNVISDKLDHNAPVQDNTWPMTIREYPGGVPEHLKISQPPPNYETYVRAYRKYFRWGSMHWGKPAEGARQFQYSVLFFYRANADSASPLTGRASELRITRCQINGGNDYPVKVSTLEDPAQRRKDEREGIYRTFSALYYFQQELGLNWALAEDEGFNTPFNRQQMKELELRTDLEKLAIYLPQQPYVRESRRIIGMKTVVANDMGRFENAKLWPTSLAMGDYFMDLHNTEESLEKDLDSPVYPKGGGTFQVPFEAFVPEKLDGFLVAEKNLSQSRLVSGATRLQPVTMLTGQAAGTIAALAVKQKVPPRKLDPIQVQAAQLESGSTLVQRWYADVPWGTPIWRATQLLTLHSVIDRPGPFKRNNELGGKSRWGVDAPLSAKERDTALAKLPELKRTAVAPPSEKATAGEFALWAAKVMVAN